MDKIGSGLLYRKLLDFGVKVNSHESDLYAIVCPESESLINQYEHKENVRRFTSNIDGKQWFDIPFAYAPFWDRRAK